MPLEVLLNKCQEDTLEFIGPGASSRLGRWRDRETDLVKFIRDRLISDNGAINGRKIYINNGVSLESIVLFRCPERFIKDDLEVALYNLRAVLTPEDLNIAELNLRERDNS